MRARACRVLLGRYPRRGRRVVGSAAKRAHSAVETAIPVALVVDFRALQAAITRMSSPGFQWRVRGLVRAALLDDSGQTNACCALLGAPTRGPERLEGCAQPPHQQERTRPEVAGSARHQAAATRSESVESTGQGKYIENRLI